ncbi:hypothetical protein [Aliivibrio fischeri]|uniref:hypothetical protein n=1 Tax=Aliivibrio fischeri TaxID=668 RepID=UPI001F3A319B|nr:hypothetical protein [Aliivibrio fischeri]MCE7553618.1 hypothetical protein [Aliivibrio fischeri]MCE7561530.1 hypothetical protein [Aliivibrio fischeri]MCE7568938.1 hypothetical protein [Aliivibrio fischeri]
MIKALFIIVAVAIFFLPIGLYTLTFGVGLWSEHSKWAEMGSALAGVYSPILALATIIILYMQFSLQQTMHKKQTKDDILKGYLDTGKEYILITKQILDQATGTLDFPSSLDNYLKASTEEEKETYLGKLYLFHGPELLQLSQLYKLYDELDNCEYTESIQIKSTLKSFELTHMTLLVGTYQKFHSQFNLE